MRIPKRFKLHEVTAKEDNNIVMKMVKGVLSLIASDNTGIAIVPVETKDIDSNRLPSISYRDAIDKEFEVTTKVMKEAVKGKTEYGEIVPFEKHIAVRSGPTKDWILMDKIIEKDKHLNLESVERLKDMIQEKAPKGFHFVEICLDASLLKILCNAIGQEEVNLRFIVNSHSKKATGEKNTNLIHITPYKRKEAGGEEAILPMLI